MRKYISKGKKKNKEEWVEGDYLFNDKIRNIKNMKIHRSPPLQNKNGHKVAAL